MEYRRASKYDFLSNIGKSLLDEIYGNRDNFIKGVLVEFNKDKFSTNFKLHPLEDYIISYDQSLEDDGIIINIGERIGFNIVFDETTAYTPAEQFYDRCSYTIRKNSTERISKIMNLTKDRYFNMMENMGLKSTDEMYYDRLNIDSHKYNRELIKSYYNIEINEINQIPEDNLTLYDEGVITNIAHIKHLPGSRVNEDLKDTMEDELNDMPIKIDVDRATNYNKDLENIDDDLSDEEFEENLEEEGLTH